MNKYFTLLLLTVLALKINAQTTYYVSSSGGNDANSGTTTVSAWKTIAKVNGTPLNAGDNVLFKRGDVWEEKTGLVLTRSGTSLNRITIGAYGSGPRPIISLFCDLEGSAWSNSANWQMISAAGTGYKWRKDENTEYISRLWLSGKEYKQAGYWNQSGTEGIFGEEYRFAKPSGYIEVWAPSNPATYYTSIKKAHTNTVTNVIYVNQADYITIEHLELRGGYFGVQIWGASYITIDDCVLGYGTERGAIYASNNDLYGWNPSRVSNYLIISNNVMNSGYGLMTPHSSYWGVIQNGIKFAKGVSYSKIFNNYLKDWHHNGIEFQGFSRQAGKMSVSFNEVYNNTFNFQGINFGRAHATVSVVNGNTVYTGSDTGYCSYNTFLRNYISGQNTNLEIAGDHNLYAYNIIDTVKTIKLYGDASGIGFEVSGIEGGTSQYNKLYNNTVYWSAREGINGYPGANCEIKNNLLINCNDYDMNKYPAYPRSGNPFVFFGTTNRGNQYLNNYIFYQGSSSSNITWSYGGRGYTTVQFNALNGTNSDRMSGNVHYTAGPLTNLITNTITASLPSSRFTPALNSPLINAGVSVGLSGDFYGRPISGLPDIGAIEYSAAPLPELKLLSVQIADAANLTVTFSNDLAAAQANNAANYTITGNVSVISALLQGDSRTVKLTTTAHAGGSTYTLLARNLTDLNGTLISPAYNSAQYTMPLTTTLTQFQVTAVTASVTSDANTSPIKTVDFKGFYDGDSYSRWAAQPMPQWLIFDLGTLRYVSLARFSFYSFETGRIYNYSLSASADMNTWTNIAVNASSASSEWTERSFDPVIARYIKLTFNSSNDAASPWAGLWEARIFGQAELPFAVANVKIILEGPYKSGSMSTSLNSKGYLPPAQPYNSAPWNYAGSERTEAFNPSIVDWVLLELRYATAAGTMVSRKAALLRNDGVITDLDGASQVMFPQVDPGSYYIVVYHRNHLSIMSSQSVNLSSGTSGIYDFTVSASNTYSTSSVKSISGVYCLIASDANADGNINDTDLSFWLGQNGTVGYRSADFNMDGVVNSIDRNSLWKSNKGLVSKVPK